MIDLIGDPLWNIIHTASPLLRNPALSRLYISTKLHGKLRREAQKPDLKGDMEKIGRKADARLIIPYIRVSM